ncbi:MAG: DUF433 domain-containing protein [Chitinophagaceae bacterium]
MANTEHINIEARIGEGIYLVKDVSKILGLDYEKVYRWIVGYWTGNLQEHYNYTFGEQNNRAINFYSLIEFYTFFKLREKGLSSTEIKKLHSELSSLLKTPYPFAIAQDYYIETRKTKKRKKTFVYYTYLESTIKRSAKKQFSLDFIKKFLDKVEFDENNLASRFFPLHDSKNVVVDPKHQFGQPVINGTNIKTQTIFNLYRGGESLENLSILYNISVDKVQDAITFQKAA